MAKTTSQNDSVPLVVDLDGTLVSTDVLFESVNQYVVDNPLNIFRIFSWLAQGKATLKKQLSQHVELDVEKLPLNSDVLELISEKSKEGSQIVLATASDQRYAKQIADSLGLFDSVLASDGVRNLKGRRKAAELVSRYGEQQFDYVGDSAADVEVWKHARRAYVVSSKNVLIREAENVTQETHRIKPITRNLTGLFRSMRVHQWVKNLLILVPLIATHRFLNVSDDAITLLAFLIFSLAASGIYILNDLFDVSHDRRHKTKHHRPIASGQLSIGAAWISWIALELLAFGLSLTLLPMDFTLVLIIYIVLTMAYSLGLKRVTIIDVVVLAALYTLRILAGAFAIESPPSYWIMTFSLFFFTSLALMKRFSELFELRQSHYTGNIGGRGYTSSDIEFVMTLGITSGLASVVVFLLYVHDPAITAMYSSPIVLWLTGPLLLLWIARAWLIAHRGLMHEDPIVFALRDKPSYLIAIAMIAVIAAAMVL